MITSPTLPHPFPYTTLFRSFPPFENDLYAIGDPAERWRMEGADLVALHGRVRRRPVLLRPAADTSVRSEEHTSELQSQSNLVCRLLLAKIIVLIFVMLIHYV